MRYIALLTCALALGGCQREPSPEDVAVTFLRLYAINVDQEGAMTLATGLAKEKLLKELADVASIRGDGFRQEMTRPKFRRQLLSAHEEGKKNVLYTYRIEMTPEIGDPTARRMLIHVERQGEAWRVVDYQFWPDTGVEAAPSQ
ncbi:MAG: hypothetical protein ABGY41_03020 [Candidatus Poribacteria bacterium]